MKGSGQIKTTVSYAVLDFIMKGPPWSHKSWASSWCWCSLAPGRSASTWCPDRPRSGRSGRLSRRHRAPGWMSARPHCHSRPPSGQYRRCLLHPAAPARRRQTETASLRPSTWGHARRQTLINYSNTQLCNKKERKDETPNFVNLEGYA